jgi:hypothetical protein
MNSQFAYNPPGLGAAELQDEVGTAKPRHLTLTRKPGWTWYFYLL